MVVDPGHGGEDLGAVVSGRREKDIVLAIALKLKERLGVSAILTRDSDFYVPLDQRVERGRAAGAAAFVSLHINKVRQKDMQGVTVFAYGKAPFKLTRRMRHGPPPLPAPPSSRIQASLELAKNMARDLRRAGFKSGSPERAEYYVLKNPEVPAVLVELGYLSNPDEARRLGDPAYQDRLVEALARSLSAYQARSRPASRPASGA